MANVIVFGATGAVGGAAAVEASERGATVWLAMRDTSKKIQAISEEQEKKGSFKRVQADLTDPASITKAVKESGAKAAFIYAVFGAKDGMKASVQALKDAGVTWVVLLSSYTIQIPVRQVKPEDVIPYFHATVEISLEEVGMPFAAMRPGYFASNEFRAVGMLKHGFYAHPYPEIKFDHIDPMNIGQVAGACLVKPQDVKPSEPQVVYIMGPQLTSVKDSMNIIGKAIGKDHIEMKIISPEEWTEDNKKHIPEPVAKYLTKNVIELHEKKDGGDDDLYKEASQNVYKYTGKKPSTFAEFVEVHKAEFTA